MKKLVCPIVAPKYPNGGLSIYSIAGAFGAHPGHDAHLHSTLSAIQILITQDALDRVDISRVTKCESAVE